MLPFIPINALDSALPATLFHLHLKNTRDRTVTATFAESQALGAGESLDVALKL